MRTLLLKVHLFLALIFGIFIVIMGLSGSVLVFRAELERAFVPGVSAADSTGNSPVNIQTAVQQYRTAHPQAVIRSITLPRSDTRDALLLSVSDGKESVARVYVDPRTGRELARRTANSDWLGWLVTLHHTLFGKGHALTGPVGVAFSVMCLTGMFVWWPGRKSVARDPAFQPRRAGRFAARDTHRLLGFWGFAVLLVLAFTGTVFTWREAYNRAAGMISGTERPPVRVQLPHLEDAIQTDFDQAIVAARGAVPDGVPTAVRPATKPGEPIIIRMRSAGELRGAGSTQVFIGTSANVMRIDRLSDAPLPYRIVDALAPVHFGEVGGLAVKLLWAVAGFFPLMLFVSGIRIWWRSFAFQRATNRPVPLSAARPQIVVESSD